MTLLEEITNCLNTHHIFIMRDMMCCTGCDWQIGSPTAPDNAPDAHKAEMLMPIVMPYLWTENLD